MLNSLSLHNFGPLQDLSWSALGRINLVLGPNGCGKTFLLKALYATMRTIEGYKRGQEDKTAAEILVEKLRWTYQADKIGGLVTKGADAPLSCSVVFNDQPFKFSFGKETTKHISSLENQVPPRPGNSIFLPAKEVLSLHHIILESRWDDMHRRCTSSGGPFKRVGGNGQNMDFFSRLCRCAE